MNEAAGGTVKSNFPTIKEDEKEAMEKTGEVVKEGIQTERQTKTDFDSTQKKKVVVKKPTSELQSTQGKITIHEPSHFKD